ncbi:Retrovirus-related Pol polyprotein from transposon TNT 1-94 [Vitis vinifera]|uniref:Retrovirus-related Pol polyprotein from transposon TNT 1-94 n=1 Tax=Vitis vinifera TaxID=29760 RepID=A0A438EHH7_VITVI|nr:Retrovirus-related Pol polyprotein from transposon TNT 1-94 [Vitis vinifera]
MGAEQTIVEVQLVIEVPQAVGNILVDQVDQELSDTSKQQVEPHTSLEDNGATLRRSTQTKRLAIPTHFDLELQQMDVKTVFLNGELEEEVYIKQPEGFPSSDENVIDQCIYLKVNGSKVCFLVLYMDDILLATNDKGLLHEVKQFLSKNFDMKDMGEASYVIGIKIHRDRFQGILGLSQETYINKVLERFRMKDCSPSVSPIVKGDRFNLNQCSKNDLKNEQMKNILYVFAVGSLMYAQVYTRPNIAFAVRTIG